MFLTGAQTLSREDFSLSLKPFGSFVNLVKGHSYIPLLNIAYLGPA